MNAMKASEQRQQTQGQESLAPQAQMMQGMTLDRRYGKIGISAVAGAVQHKLQERPAPRDRRFMPEDCD
jgi:hypothetical protein